MDQEKFKGKLLEFISNNQYSGLVELKKILEDDKNITEEYPSTPGKQNVDNIRSTGEKAFQRAGFNNKEIILNYKKPVGSETVKWFDLELPVILNKNPRRRCLDLIGFSDETPVICELKYFEKTRSDNPLYAVIELLIYYYFIHCNYQKLDKHSIHHKIVAKDFKWEMIAKHPHTKLLVVANKAYWNYWFKKMNKDILSEQVARLGQELESEIHLFEAPNEDFVSQKNLQPTFNPFITSNIWQEI